MIRGFPLWKLWLATFGTTLSVWMMNRLLILFMRVRFPGIENTGTRVVIQFAISTLMSSLLSLLISWFFDRSRYFGYDLTGVDYLYNLGVVLFFVYMALGVYETIFYFSKWRQTLTETEALKKANLVTQLESLKNQVSPHFLFNSLNTLTVLIDEDPKQAQRFVEELAGVYRYLLQSNEKNLITLREELRFLDSYYFLLKVRFRDGIHLNVEVPEDKKEMLIPPLTLQILVENAVKHNVISSQQPLMIRILAPEDKNLLQVINNLHKKIMLVGSGKVGLANIRSKYRLLGQETMRVEENGKSFTVEIPLLRK